MGLKLLRKISTENFGKFQPKKKKKTIFEKNPRYEIVIHVILFDLFLSLNEDKLHCNISNSLGAMIFLSY